MGGQANTLEQLTLVYDGACPFCQHYTALLDLHRPGRTVKLLDAREHPQVVADLAARGLNVDDGMVADYQGCTYAGADALHLLALLSTGSSFTDRLICWLFRSPRRARLSYPVLRAVRNGTLKVLGHQPIRPH